METNINQGYTVATSVAAINEDAEKPTIHSWFSFLWVRYEWMKMNKDGLPKQKQKFLLAGADDQSMLITCWRSFNPLRACLLVSSLDYRFEFRISQQILWWVSFYHHGWVKIQWYLKRTKTFLQHLWNGVIRLHKPDSISNPIEWLETYRSF